MTKIIFNSIKNLFYNWKKKSTNTKSKKIELFHRSYSLKYYIKKIEKMFIMKISFIIQIIILKLFEKKLEEE